MEEVVSVLLVEDNKNVINELTDLLEGLGYDVISFKKGEQAIRHFPNISPTLIIMDIELKGVIDGIETTKRIKELKSYRGQPILYHTKLSDRFDDANETLPSHWSEKNQGLEQVIKNVKLVLKNSKRSFWDKKRDTKLVHIESSNGFKRFIHKDSIVAVALRNDDNSSCNIHIYEDGERKTILVTKSLKQIIEKLGITTLKKVNSRLALNFVIPFYKGILDKKKEDATYVRMNRDYLFLDSHVEGQYELTRTYKSEVRKMIDTL